MAFQYTYVYLIHDPDTELYKIGRADNPDARLKQLTSQQTILAKELDYYIDDAWLAPVEMERELHARFAEYRVRGEWFQLDESRLDELRDVMKYCQRWGGVVPEAVESAHLERHSIERRYQEIFWFGCALADQLARLYSHLIVQGVMDPAWIKLLPPPSDSDERF